MNFGGLAAPSSRGAGMRRAVSGGDLGGGGEGPDVELNLVRFTRAVRRHLLLFLVVAGVVTGLAVLRIILATPVYNATSQVLLVEEVDTPLSMDTELAVAGSDPIQDAATASLPEDQQDIVTGYSVLKPVDTTVIAFTAHATEPEVAQAAADAYANAYAERRIDIEQTRLQQQVDILNENITGLQDRITALDQQLQQLEPTEDPDNPSVLFQSLQTQRDAVADRLVTQQTDADAKGLDAASADGGLQRLSDAELPETPASPVPVRDGILGLLLGLVAGLVAANARDLTDDRIRRTSDVSAILPVPILGFLPEARSTSGRPVVVDDPDGTAAEAFRALRTSIATLTIDQSMRTLLVTSAEPGEGKTTVAANLAAAFALDGRRVIAVDADLRRPAMHKLFEAPNERGLADVLNGRAELSNASTTVEVAPGATLRFMCSGSRAASPAELVGSTGFIVLCDTLRRIADLVVFDAPPLLPVTDAVLIGQRVDALLLVVTMEQTRRRDLRAIAELVNRTGLPVVGVAINRLAPPGSRYRQNRRAMVRAGS